MRVPVGFGCLPGRAPGEVRACVVGLGVGEVGAR